jgi:hypothetical protein
MSRERFVEECELLLLGGAVKVSLVQAPSAKSSSKLYATVTTPSSGRTRKGTAPNHAFSSDTSITNSRANDPALTGTTVVT